VLVGTSQDGLCGSPFDPASSRSQLRRRAQDASGFMLTELLVVVLIIGILAAIAVPSFLGHKSKAIDTQAKTLARTAQMAAETIATEHNGLYENVSTLELKKVEASIRIAGSTTDAYVSAASGGKTSYAVTAKATNGDEFTVTRNASGEVTRTCSSPLLKTGCSGGGNGSW
jgi:type IV pilus assembly protein PilA